MMKNRGTTVSNTCKNCQKKLIKSPSSLSSSQNRKACKCEKKSLKTSGHRNNSRLSEKSNSQSRHTTRSQNQHQQLHPLSQNQLSSQYQTYEQKSPRQHYDLGGNTLTNLRIAGCEFPMIQTARNPPLGNMFTSSDSIKTQAQFDTYRPSLGGLIQQPLLNTQSFSTLNSVPLNSQYPLQATPSTLQYFQSTNNQNLGPLYSPQRGQNKKDYQGTQISQFRQFSPSMKDINMQQSQLTPKKQILTHYDRIINEFELYSKQRANNLRDGLSKIIDGLKTDDIISAMREDPLSHNYAYQRMRELVDNTLISESEQIIGNLRSENVLLREKILIIEADNQKKILTSVEQERLVKRLKHANQRKNHYKQQLKQSQEQIGQLLNKFKEVELEILKQQQDFEVKLAQKDGELARCEKVLSEVRGMLSEKTIAQSKLENNLSNEVTVLSDRIVSLQKENNDINDQYQKYDQEFKVMMEQEYSQLQLKIQKQKDKIKEMKTQIERQKSQENILEQKVLVQAKEMDEMKFKIDELVKQSQEKLFKLRDVEEKQTIQERDLSSQLREQKQKYKSKIKELQSSFEQALQEKLHQIENETREKILQTENEKREIESKFAHIQNAFELKQEEDRQNMIVLKKQMEKKIEKLQEKYEQEIQLKLSEAEDTFKELELRIRKEYKNDKKQWNLNKEKEIEQQQEQVQQMQERYESEFREMSFRLREEIDQLQAAAQDNRIKIAELNILVDTHKAEAERLARDNDNLLCQQREIITQNRREVQMYEEKLQQKIQENDDKIKHALDQAIKNSNLESIAKSYALELDKKQSEIQSVKDQYSRLNNKYEQVLDEKKLLQVELQSSKQINYDKEFKICKLQSTLKESLSKIVQVVRLQSSKYKQELEYLKRHYYSEQEITKKGIESQVLAIISKSREVSYTQKFKLEKLQYQFEQRFQKEFNAREAEWEKIWEKREEQIESKEKIIKDLENERLHLRENLARYETEMNQLKSQLQTSKQDLSRQYEEVRTKLQLNEQKQSELTQTYKRQEDHLLMQQRQQLNDLRVQMQLKSTEELKKLELQLNENRDKSKQKINDLAQHLQEVQQKHRQDVVNMKNLYESKIKELEIDNDDKQKSLYESQNKINILQIKCEQFLKDNELMEKQIQELTKQEKQLITELAGLKQIQTVLQNERDELLGQKEVLEKDLNELNLQNRILQSQIYTAERKLAQQKNDLKKKMRKLHQSKERELQEVQFLNDILTRNPTSAVKVNSRKSQVNSPDFKRNLSQMQGFQTIRGGETQRLNQSSSNYGNILSEINNMIDAKQLRLSCSNGKSQLGKSQRFSNIVCSPSVGQLNPSMTFYHKSILRSPQSNVNDENAQMRISDLKQI